MLTATHSQPVNAEWITPASLVSKRDRAIYDLGKQKGKEEVDNDFQANLNRNFERSYHHTTEFLNFLKNNNVYVLDAKLKFEHLSDLKVAVIIKEEDNLSEKISSIYDFVYDLEGRSNSDDYNIDFTIVKADCNFQDKLVENDGFIFTHQLLINDGESEKERTRAEKS